MKYGILQKPLVDVIIPNYLRKAKLFRAVNSVLNQDAKYLNQIIVIDDGSDKDVRNYYNSVFSKFAKVKVIEHQHTGLPGKLRDEALNYVNAELVAFLDSDDWWDENKLSIQVPLLLNGNSVGVCSNAICWTNDGPSNFFPRNREIPTLINFSELVRDNLIINSSMIVRTESLRQIGGYPSDPSLKAVEDYATWLRLATLGTFIYDSNFLVHYSDSNINDSIRNFTRKDPRINALKDFVGWAESNRLAKKVIEQANSELVNFIKPKEF